MVLLILCAPVCARSSRFRTIRAPPAWAVRRGASVMGVERPTNSRSRTSSSAWKEGSARAVA